MAALLGRSKGNHRPVNRFFYSRGKNPHHPFVPFLAIQAQARRQVVRIQPGHLLHGRIAHAVLDGATLPVDGVQVLGHLSRFGIGFRQQTSDALGHVGEPPRCIQPWPHGEAHVRRQYPAGIAPGHLQQRADPRAALAGTNPPQALLHQHPVGIVQHHHIGHRAQRHQVQQIGNRRAGGNALLAQRPLQVHQQIKRHPDPGQVDGGEILTTGQARVHQRIRFRQGIAGQMVVGNQHPHTLGTRSGHPIHTGNTVIHGDDQVRVIQLFGQIDDGRRQAIAVFKAVWHQEIRARVAQPLQAPHHQRGGRGTVRVVVTHNADAPVVCSPL